MNLGLALALAILRIALRLELGPEYDTNANRVEVVKGVQGIDHPIGAALIRTTVKGSLAFKWEWYRATLNAGFGSKVFMSRSVFDQSVLVGQVGLDNRFRVAAPVEAGLGGDYYDATQPTHPTSCPEPECLRHRDFRSGTAQGRLTFLDRAGVFSVVGGYRGFLWKPDHQFDFNAAQMRAIASTRATIGKPGHEHEFDLTASYLAEPRRFHGLVERNDCPPGTTIQDSCIDQTTSRRFDWFHEASLELSYLGPVLASVGYAVQLNRSNSFGQSLLRHVVSLKLGFRMPAKIYATIKAQVLAATYLDPVLLDRNVQNQSFVSIEDENRNSLIIDLERPFANTGLGINARYSLFTNELSKANAQFMRHTVYLGVSYKFGTGR